MGISQIHGNVKKWQAIFATTAILTLVTVAFLASDNESLGSLPYSASATETDDQMESRTANPENLEEQRSSWEKENEDSILYGVDLKSRIDLSIDGDILRPLSDYRNPCWIETVSEANPNRNFREYCRFSSAEKECSALTDIYIKRWQAGKRSRLRCLPYFFFVGVTKAGTTDLKYMLSKHPDIARPLLSEINWWNRRRQGAKKRVYGTFGYSTFDEYIGTFDMAALEIENRTVEVDGEPYHQMITYDGSSQLFWEHDGWETLPANLGLSEPKVTYIDTLRMLRPDAKIIMMFRDPVERVFSHYYMHFGKKKVAVSEHFHNSTVYAIDKMNECLSKYSLRRCIFDTRLSDDLFVNSRVMLRAGIYAAFYNEWVQVFGARQVIVVKSEDYYKDRVTTLNKITQFLGLDSYTTDGESSTSKNEVKPKYQRLNKPEMYEKTRNLLQQFYMPHNKVLARTLKDKRFLWLDKS